MPTILLARHGETADNVPPQRIQGWRDVPLNARGREQARALADAAERAAGDGGLRALWTSHLARARETAEIVGAALGLTPRVDERLAESRRGSWEGRAVADIQREDAERWAAWMRAGAGFRFPGGESLEEHLLRTAAALDDVRRGPVPALVVCHGGTIRCALAGATARGLDAYHEIDVPNAEPIRLP
ncbi:MAG: histidine phosphatase family protein [Actinobacteria bacterium]|nr:histidine phosphatase family protein [Actinomycetota bacterium]